MIKGVTVSRWDAVTPLFSIFPLGMIENRWSEPPS